MTNQFFIETIGMKISKSDKEKFIKLINFDKIWSIIPARSGSTRVKNKNLQKINGKELLLFSISLSKSITCISQTFISTDSKRIANVSMKYGAKSPFLRPKKISGKYSSDISYVIDFLKQVALHENHLPYLIIQLRPTTPFRNKAIVEKAIKVFENNYKKYDSLRSSNLLTHPPEKTYRIKQNRYVDINMNNLNSELSNKPSQLFKPTYRPNGYVDIIKTEHVINFGNLYGNKIYPFVTSETIEIDTLLDLNYARIDNSRDKLKLINKMIIK